MLGMARFICPSSSNFCWIGTCQQSTEEYGVNGPWPPGKYFPCIKELAPERHCLSLLPYLLEDSLVSCQAYPCVYMPLIRLPLPACLPCLPSPAPLCPCPSPGLSGQPGLPAAMYVHRLSQRPPQAVWHAGVPA